MLATRVDTAPLSRLLIAAGVAIACLIVSLIVGGAGPRRNSVIGTDSYLCNNGSHTYFDPVNCSGVQPDTGQWSAWMEFQAPSINKAWLLVVTPYSLIHKSWKQAVVITAQVEARYNSTYVWTAIGSLNGTSVKSEIVCFDDAYEHSCIPFILLSEDFIQFDDYRVRVKFEVPIAGYLADVKYDIVTTSDAFSRLSIGIRLTYAIISIIVCVIWVYLMKSKINDYDDWSFEARSCLALIVALLFFNNPLHPIEYFTSGWIVPFLNSALELLFICTVCMFWIYHVDALRGHIGDAGRLDGRWGMRVKFIFVGVFGAMAISLFMWESIRSKLSPVFGITTHVTGIQVIYYATSVCYASLIVWLCLQMILAMPNAVASPQVSIRFLFFAIPSALCMLSMLIGIFTGNLISFGRSTLNFMYFHTLFNVFVYLMMWGFWPSYARYNPLTPTETSNIFGDGTKTVRNYM